VVIHDNDLQRLCNKQGIKTLELELPELNAAKQLSCCRAVILVQRMSQESMQVPVM